MVKKNDNKNRNNLLKKETLSKHIYLSLKKEILNTAQVEEHTYASYLHLGFWYGHLN